MEEKNATTTTTTTTSTSKGKTANFFVTNERKKENKSQSQKRWGFEVGVLGCGGRSWGGKKGGWVIWERDLGAQIFGEMGIGVELRYEIVKKDCKCECKVRVVCRLEIGIPKYLALHHPQSCM